MVAKSRLNHPLVDETPSIFDALAKLLTTKWQISWAFD
jgi:hypothetical protein